MAKTKIFFLVVLMFITFGTFSRTISSGDTIANNLIVPGIFTPDKAGADKKFYIKSLNSSLIKSVKMQIYNRWGEKVFETDSIMIGWDGKFNGKPVPEGTYIYSIYVELFDQTNNGQITDTDHKGYLNLLR